jgi:hypothetical protein
MTKKKCLAAGRYPMLGHVARSRQKRTHYTCRIEDSSWPLLLSSEKFNVVFWWEIFTRQNGYFKGMVYSLRTGESLSINWDFASQNGDLIVMRLTTQNISVFQ